MEKASPKRAKPQPVEPKIISSQVSMDAWRVFDSITMMRPISVNKIYGVILEEWLVSNGFLAPDRRYTSEETREHFEEAVKKFKASR